MTEHWTAAAARLIDAAPELEIAVRRTDGTLHAALPIWVVVADGAVYVRTWYRRDTGWFGRILRSGRARIRVPGFEADVAALDLGSGPAATIAAVDAAYRAKYGAGGSTDRMVSARAASTTVRLDPEHAPHP